MHDHFGQILSAIEANLVAMKHSRTFQPDRMEDSLALLKDAVGGKVACVPGPPFFQGGGGDNTMRLNFSNARDEQIEEGVRRLSRVVMRQFEARKETVPA